MAVWHIQPNINLGGGGGGSATLQTAYTNSTPPVAEITLNAVNGPIRVNDAPVSIGDLFIIRDSTGAITLFKVDGAGDTLVSGILTSDNLKRGTGNPNAVVSGNVGDIFLRTDAPTADTTLWVSTGGMAWTALTSSGGSITFINDNLTPGAPVVPPAALGALSFIPSQVASLQLDVNGNTQTRGTDYTILGAAITWTGSFTINTTDDVIAYYVI